MVMLMMLMIMMIKMINPSRHWSLNYDVWMCRLRVWRTHRHIRHAAIVERLKDSEDHQYGTVHYRLSRLKMRFREFIVELWDQMASVRYWMYI